MTTKNTDVPVIQADRDLVAEIMCDDPDEADFTFAECAVAEFRTNQMAELVEALEAANKLLWQETDCTSAHPVITQIEKALASYK